MKSPAARATSLPRSAIRVLFDAADQREGVLRLEVGEPSFTTPAHIIDAAKEAAAAGYTRYGPNGGLVSLRELLVEKVSRVNGLGVSMDQVVVTPGGMNALYSTYLALLDSGDEVLLPTPGFPNMDSMVTLLGGRPVFYELLPTDRYLPDIERLESLVTDRTKLLFINTPANPTGAVYPASLMRDLVEFANRHNLWILCDEVYDELLLTDEAVHTSAGLFDTDGRVITVFSFSKVYAMTGWRVGYAVAPPAIAQLLRTLQEPQVSCPSTISQKAAEAALTGPREPIDAMRQAYVERRGAALAAIDRVGLETVAPDGTLYLLIRIGDRPTLQFALDLLEHQNVSVAPGVVFGPAGSGMVRISLAAAADVIVDGVTRLAAELAQQFKVTS